MQPKTSSNNQEQNNNGVWLPGHPYHAGNGNSESGIEWLSTGQVRLWYKGQVVLEATHSTATEWQFWYELAFLEAFPQVDYWWFGSFWTGKVKLFYSTEVIAPNIIKGSIQFVDDETEPGQWTLFSGDAKTLTPAQIFTDLPPFEDSLANFPLRLKLAELVVELMQGDIPANEWQLATSLVTPDELVDELLPSPDYAKLPAWQLTKAVLGEGATGLFKAQPVQGELPSRHRREDFCLALGLSPEKDALVF